MGRGPWDSAEGDEPSGREKVSVLGYEQGFEHTESDGS